MLSSFCIEITLAKESERFSTTLFNLTRLFPGCVLVEPSPCISPLTSLLSHTLFKVFIYLAAPGCSCSTRDLQWHLNSASQHMGSSSLTRDQTEPPALEAWSPSHWTTREVAPSLCMTSLPTCTHGLDQVKVSCCFLFHRRVCLVRPGVDNV